MPQRYADPTDEGCSRPITPISPMGVSCSIGFTNPCKILSDTINDVVIDPVNDAFKLIDKSICGVENGLVEVNEWWDEVKDDVEVLVKDMDLIMDILDMDIFSYILAWLRAITGMSLEVVRIVAIVIIVIVALALLGGLASLLRLFL